MITVKYRRLLDTEQVSAELLPLVQRASNKVIANSLKLIEASINPRLAQMGGSNTMTRVTLWLKLSVLADELNLTEKQVKSALAKLREAGIITAEKKLKDDRGWLQLWAVNFITLKKSLINFVKITMDGSKTMTVETVKENDPGFLDARRNLRNFKKIFVTPLYHDAIDYFEELRDSIISGDTIYEDCGNVERYNMMRLLNFKG